MREWLAILILAICAFMSVLAFIFYGVDKKRSKRRRARRISERTLLLLSIFGGGIGAFFGMRIFRHKTKHMNFRIIVPLTAIAQLFLILSAIYMLLVPGDTGAFRRGDGAEESAAVSSAAEHPEASLPESLPESSAESLPESSAPEEPTPMQLSYDPDILANPAGTVIPEDALDWENARSYFTSSPIEVGDEVYDRINGKSYRENDDIALSSLRYLKMLHFNFDDEVQVGEMIVNEAIEADVLDIFYNLFLNRYQIRSMYLIDEFWTGDGVESDDASIEADNTSCFCYRRATDAENLSRHAYGMAIDLNPFENPFIYVHEDGSFSCDHEGSYAYIENRSPEMPHVITHEDLAYQLFAAHGFTWGGDWSSPIDYQHFVK